MSVHLIRGWLLAWLLWPALVGAQALQPAPAMPPPQTGALVATAGDAVIPPQRLATVLPGTATAAAVTSAESLKPTAVQAGSGASRYAQPGAPVPRNPARYRGKRLSLQFQDIEVRALLQVLADFTGINIVAADSVQGRMSLRLKEVPWEQALEVILQTRGLAMQRNGQVIWVAPQQELASLQQQAQSAPADGVLESRSYRLNYARAGELAQQVHGGGGQAARLLSARGSAFADARTNQLVVQDVAAVQAQIQQLIEQLDIPVRQVMIEARIVEAGENWGQSLGARLSVLGQPNGASGMDLGDGRRLGVASVPGQAATPLYQLPALGQNGFAPAALGLSLFSAGASRFVTLEISALQADGKGKLVSSPRVVTADQTRALIEQGTELPYQVATASGATSLAFRKANLKLEVTPQITPEGQIVLDLDVNKDSVGRTTLNGFAIDTKHIQTNVLVENGGTLVIGGIFEISEREDVTKVPLLGDIPYLGGLFRSRSQVTEKKEMLVFITPTIVESQRLARR
ncbi:type IV pilus secretin PilQ [Brachymonas sp. G13]|uniref:type IV pilus secretin PilQ n=1 Tax=Brachymonas wangyanguii TaxID=3130163 RepID=UPI0016B2CC2B|nr:type IV pilus secretin PilQ [Ramlibacter sp.]